MNSTNTTTSPELDINQLNALEASNDHLVEVPAVIQPTKLKAKRKYFKGIWALPFTACHPNKSDTPFWIVSASGGYTGGIEAGRAMAESYLKLLRDLHLPANGCNTFLTAISESINTRIKREYNNALESNEQSYEYDSLYGQSVGFFNTLDRWLADAAKRFNSSLDGCTNNDFIKLANNGLKQKYSDK